MTSQIGRRPSSEFTFHIETLGCPKNRVDSRRMRAALLQSGFVEGTDAESSEIILINSCSFIREAQEETVDTVFQALELKKESNQKVALVGCFAERFPDETKKEIPELDLLVGTGKFEQVPDILANQFDIELSTHEASGWQFQVSETEKPYAYFRIASGCSRNCGFCILPTIRGPLQPLTEKGIRNQFDHERSLRRDVPLREAILVSQDTISQGVAELEHIIAVLSADADLEWIRLQYLFPDRRVLKLLELFEKYPKLVPYLDIPFQHASPSILKSMNRPDNVDLFKEIIDKALQVRPDIEIRTSFILGFPGETEKDVDTLRTFLDSTPIHKLALFRYSHEKGTPAETLADDLPDEVKIDRINSIRNHHLEVRQEARRALVGTMQEVIVDSIADGEVEARRSQDSPEIDEVVFVQGKAKDDLNIGDIIPVELQMPLEYDWFAEFRA